MLISADVLLKRVRAVGRGEEGASIVVVVALMAVGFIISVVILSACLFAINQNVKSTASIQAFAAAEAGRDRAVAELIESTASCVAHGGRYESGGDPAYEVYVYAVDGATAPSTYPGAVEADGTPTATRCPDNASTYVVFRAIGQTGDGRSTVDAVYSWSRYRDRVAGGALGYMDASYQTSFSRVSGDTVIKHGDFTCNWGTVFDGSVYLLDGDVNVGVDLTRVTGNPSCEITGDLIVNGSITTANPTWVLVWFYARLKVGGQIKVTGDIDVDGRIEAGTDPARPYHDVVAGGRIHLHHSQARLSTSNGGSIKALGEIRVADGQLSSSGAVVTNTNLIADSTVSAGGAITAVQNIGGGGSLSAGGAMTAGGSIGGSGARSAGGDMTAAGGLEGSGARTAGGSIRVNGSISVDGTVTANGGDITARGDIAGSGARTAAGGVRAAGAISTSGAVTANGGDIHAQSINGGARTAQGSVLSLGDIASGAQIQALTGNIATNGSITGAGARIAGSGGASASPRGSITAHGGIESGSSTIAVDVLAKGDVKVDGSCTIQRDVHAGGRVIFDDVVSSTSTSWNSPTCTIGRNLYAGSSAPSTLGKYRAPSGCLFGFCATSGTYPNTRLATPVSSTTMRVPAGWTADANRYMVGGGSVGTAATNGPNPGAPVIPTVPALTPDLVPTVIAPSAFTLVLNEDPDGTWETFDDLQLRSTWVDLGTYTTWPGYHPVPAVSGAACSSWFNPGGQIRSILSTSSAVTSGGVLLAPASEPVVIDATACASVDMAWSSFNLARDAVILVNRANFNLAPFRQTGATADKPRQLFVIQVDPDEGRYTPSWGGAPEPVPHCAGRSKISMTATGWGGLAWDPLVNVLLYSPCGIDGSIGNAWRGHIYVHNDSVHQNVLSTMTCRPMEIAGLVDLPCDINDVTGTGSMNTNRWRLGDRISQTEP